MFGHFAIKLFFILISCCIALSNGKEPYSKYVIFNSNTYQFNPQTRVTADRSLPACGKVGGNPAMPSTQEELDFMKAQITIINDEIELEEDPYLNGYWVGAIGASSTTSFDWVWADGKSLKGGNENENWMKGSPDNPLSDS